MSWYHLISGQRPPLMFDNGNKPEGLLCFTLQLQSEYLFATRQGSHHPLLAELCLFANSCAFSQFFNIIAKKRKVDNTFAVTLIYLYIKKRKLFYKLHFELDKFDNFVVTTCYRSRPNANRPPNR